MLQLDKLSPLCKKRKRIGRGGSRGGTSGKGHKGQKARSGSKIRPGFEGGQMPLFRRLPKRGFNNARHRKEVFIVHLGRLSEVFDEGIEVTPAMIIQKGLVPYRRSAGVKTLPAIKVLSDSKPVKKLMIQANAFSKSAKKAIEESGGDARLTKEI